MDFFNKLYYSFLNSKTRIILLEALDLTLELLPYLLLGILLTVLLKLYVSKERIIKIFTSRGKLGIIISSLLGVVSPLGSYIVLPMSGALLTIGIPLPVIMAFIISSPLINPNLFLLTAGAMGYQMAIARVVSAFIIGLIAGYGTQFLMNRKVIIQDAIIKPGAQMPTDKFFNETKKKITLKLLVIEFYKMTRWVSRYFFIAILLAAIIKIVFTPQMIPSLFTGNEVVSIIISVFAGIPFYVCGGAAIPFVQALAELGLSRGAVLAFFISGPATRISNLLILFSLYRKRVFIFYILCCLIGALALGYIFNLITFVKN